MPKQTTFQIQSRQVTNTLEDQHKYDLPTLRRLGVFAEPVNTEIKPGASGAMRLANALAEAKPELMNALQGAQKDAYEEDINSGTTKAYTTGNLDYDQAIEMVAGESRGVREGFMRTKGFLTGETLRNKMLEDWQTTDKSQVDAEGKPTFDTDKWLGDWWKEHTQGFQDPHFLSGLNKQMGPAFSHVKEDWTAQNVKQVQEQRSISFQDLLAGDIKAAKLMGRDYTPEDYAKRTQDFLEVNGGHPRETAAATVGLVETAAKNGGVDTVEQLIKLKDYKSPDGIKVFGKSLANADELLRHAAANHGLAVEAKKKALKAELEDKYESTMTDMLIEGLTTGNRDTTMEKLTGFFKDHPEFGVRGIAEMRNIFDATLKKEETREMQASFANAFVQVDTGKMGREGVQKLIADREISPNQGVTLLARIKANADQARMEGNQNAAIKRQERQDLKQTILSSSFKHLSPQDTEMLGREEGLRYSQEVSILQYSAAREIDSVLGDPSKEQDLILKYQKRSMDLLKQYTEDQSKKFVGFKPKWTTKQQLEEALKSGANPAEVQLHIQYMKWMAEKQSRGTTK